MVDVGLMLGMLMHSQCNNLITGMFGNTWKTLNLPKRSVLSNVQTFYRLNGEVGYSTNGYKVLESLIAENKVVDKVLIFTDVQMWNSTNTNHTFAKSWAAYKRIAPHAKLYLFDLAGYGQQPINMLQNDVYLMAGWSDKVFDMLHALEHSNSAVTEINKMEV